MVDVMYWDIYGTRLIVVLWLTSLMYYIISYKTIATWLRLDSITRHVDHVIATWRGNHEICLNWFSAIIMRMHLYIVGWQEA